MSGQFSKVSFGWHYSIDTAPLPPLSQSPRFLSFSPQKDKKSWLCTGGSDIRILASAVVVKLLNEALQRGLLIQARKLATGDVIFAQGCEHVMIPQMCKGLEVV